MPQFTSEAIAETERMIEAFSLADWPKGYDVLVPRIGDPEDWKVFKNIQVNGLEQDKTWQVKCQQ